MRPYSPNYLCKRDFFVLCWAKNFNFALVFVSLRPGNLPCVAHSCANSALRLSGEGIFIGKTLIYYGRD